MDRNELICVGDNVALYCTDTKGYVFNEETSCARNQIYIHCDQDKERPEHVSSAQVVTYSICIENRYKLNKKYRRLIDKQGRSPPTEEAKKRLDQAKVSAKSETADNVAEQERLHGKPLKYGDILQLQHLFTDKCVHVNTHRTSKHDKSKLEVELQSFDARGAHFKILPKYKVNIEGENVRCGEPVVFESMKSPGHYLHASPPISIAQYDKVSELNLGIDSSEFCLAKRFTGRYPVFYTPNLWGGAIVQIQHRDLEAYLSAEGVFGDELYEDVHLHVHEADIYNPKTLYPMQACNIFWQLEADDSVINGGTIQFGQHVRLRHLITRQYLYVRSEEGDLGLTPSTSGPDGASTVFKLHSMHNLWVPVASSPEYKAIPPELHLGRNSLVFRAKYETQLQENDQVKDGKFARLQHVLTGKWLHGSKEKNYTRKTSKWKTSQLKQIWATGELHYSDAYCIQRITYDLVKDCNFFMGIVPLLRRVISQIRGQKDFKMDDIRDLTYALAEVKDVLLVPETDRKMFMRDMKIIDMLVEILRSPMETDTKSPVQLLFISIYELLYTSIKDGELQNCLCLSEYLDFFQAQLTAKDGYSVYVTRILVELVKDKKQVIDRINLHQIDCCIHLLRKYEHYRYLQLLSSLCVCNDVGIPENQSYIADKLLQEKKSYLYHFELVDQRVQIWKKTNSEPVILAQFLKEVTSDDKLFLKEQQHLFQCLCFGRNQHCIEAITKEGFITWDVAFSVLTAPDIDGDIKTLFCEVIIALFVDVGENISLVESNSKCYRMDDVDHKKTGEDWLKQQIQYIDNTLHTKIPEMRDWMLNFFAENNSIILENEQKNNLLLSALKLAHSLIQYGYLSIHYIKPLIPVLLSLMQGVKNTETTLNNPLQPFTRGILRKTKSKKDYMAGHSKLYSKVQMCEKTRLVMDVMYQGMLILELLQTMQFNFRLEKVISIFKKSYEKDQERRSENPMSLLLNNKAQQGGMAIKRWFISAEKELKNTLTEIFDTSTYIPEDEYVAILLNLAHYESEKMPSKALDLLRQHYQCRSHILLTAKDAKLLSTGRSLAVEKDVRTFMPLLRRLVSVKLYDDQVLIVTAILDKFKDCCEMPCENTKPCTMGQNILWNFGVLPVLISILQLEEKGQNGAALYIYEGLVRHTLLLLTSLTRRHSTIQNYLFGQLSVLLQLKVALPELADVLTEIFSNNPLLCWRVARWQVHRIFEMISQYHHIVPSLPQVLQRLVALDDGETLVRRNQLMVTQLYLEVYPKSSQLFEAPAKVRRRILNGQEGQATLSYFLNLTNLIALCAKDSTGTTLSFSQNILPLEEILSILANVDINPNLKRPFVKYLSWVYLASGNQEYIHTILHHWLLWEYLQQVLREMDTCIELTKRKNIKDIGFILSIGESLIATSNSKPSILEVYLFYMKDAVMPLLEEMCKHTIPSNQEFPLASKTLKRLGSKLRVLTPYLALTMNRPTKLLRLKACITALCAINGTNIVDSEAALQAVDENFRRHENLALSQSKAMEMEQESVINRMMDAFLDKCQQQMETPNTIGAQLGLIQDKKLSQRPYLPHATEDLPLQPDFQQHVRTFMVKEMKSSPISARYHHAVALVKQLGTIAERARLGHLNPDDQLLGTNCLQLLRAMVYNKIIVIKPSDKVKKNTVNVWRQREVLELQNFFTEAGLVTTACRLLAMNNTGIFHEVTALLEVMLYGANIQVQNDAYKHFLETRDELIFRLIQQCFKMSAEASKERKLLDEQKNEDGVQDQQLVTVHDETKKPFWYRNKKLKKNKVAPDFAMTSMDTYEELSREYVDSNRKEDANIRMILKVLGGFCDGQHKGLQDYIREQPDNLRTYNLVATVTDYLGQLYSSISTANIDLVIQIFSTLNELCQGNQKNRCVILDSKIVDYINFLLRAESYKECTMNQVLELHKVVADLLISLMEESSPGALQVAKDIATTLDVVELLDAIRKCYDIQHANWWSLRIRRAKRLKNMEGMGQIDWKNLPTTLAQKVGYHLCIIYKRVRDIYSDSALPREQEKEPLGYYNERIYSVEVIKDDHLQKIYFPVARRRPIRPEVKEKLKWNIDRSSPTNKIRDFMRWSKVIIKDIYYQEKILANPLTRFFSKQWLMWNYGCIFLSLVANIIMLATWEAKYSVADLPPNPTALPAMIHDINPRPTMDKYDTILYVIGITHNVLSVILLVCFYLTHNPSLPTCDGLRNFCRTMFGGADVVAVKKDTTEGTVTSVFGVKSIYYVLFVALSLAGTFSNGYFFAFHLLNIVTVNTLLQGVIRAVTLNGRSLILVALLGLVVLYLYALIGFAAFRPSFDPSEELYCATLYQCAVTIIRYGLIGDIGEFMRLHPLENTFENFGYLVLYQITFFIFFTTIGLNIIFGIIVDTFSELRDCKWVAEKDMKDFCFICSLPSYDFEHHTKGFEHHVRQEHNMWAYIYYFIYLTNTNRKDYRALDVYVAKLRDKEDYTFFPLNRALSLSKLRQEEESSKLDKMHQDMQNMMHLFNQERKAREERKLKRVSKRWRKVHIVPGRGPPPSSAPSSPTVLHGPSSITGAHGPTISTTVPLVPTGSLDLTRAPHSDLTSTSQTPPSHPVIETSTLSVTSSVPPVEDPTSYLTGEDEVTSQMELDGTPEVSGDEVEPLIRAEVAQLFSSPPSQTLQTDTSEPTRSLPVQPPFTRGTLHELQARSRLASTVSAHSDADSDSSTGSSRVELLEEQPTITYEDFQDTDDSIDGDDDHEEGQPPPSDHE